ncbi:hypothetical protein RND71_015213 [Anisodus tanguticus]|uniref:Uncharacterized protein n=1 Tax=Anisodus tanguticus TaxID=243964 RepID=A0AAE1S5F1_9SOLA|nr:hypothetical protein RND71_015213 [Anisodus tanguticus]
MIKIYYFNIGEHIIKELEENYERVRLNLDELESLKMQYDDLNMNSHELEDSKEEDNQLIVLPFNMIISTSIRLSLKIQNRIENSFGVCWFVYLLCILVI